MINETDGIDNRDADTWRDGEKVEAVLITTRGPGTLIRIGHPDGPFYVDASKFASVVALATAEPDQLRSIRSLRIMLTEERLAAATARSDKAMAAKKVEDVLADIQLLRQHANEVLRSHQLAVAALEYIRTQGDAKLRPLLDTLLPTTDRQGSLALACDADLEIERQICVDCEPPCTTTVATLPCMLPRGHAFVSSSERHRTLDGQEFETGETVLVGEDDD